MPDPNCHYFILTGNKKNKIPTRCLAPLRYQSVLDISNLTDDFSCGSNNYEECPWNPQKKGLIRLIEN